MFINYSHRLLIAFMFLIFIPKSYAVIETYDFKLESSQERYNTFVDELRCPKCQNQNLSGSNSPIARDLRRELHRMIEEGQSDSEIQSFMVQRYGNFVLYRPPLDAKTFLLWGAPLILGFLAACFVFMFKRKTDNEEKSLPLSDQEKQAIDDLLKQYS